MRPGPIYRARPVTRSSAVSLQSMQENERPFLGSLIRASGMCRYLQGYGPAVVSVLKRSQTGILQSLRVQLVLESYCKNNFVLCGRRFGQAYRAENGRAYLLR